MNPEPPATVKDHQVELVVVATVPCTVSQVRTMYSAGSIRLASPEFLVDLLLQVSAEEAGSVQPGDAVELVLRKAAT